MVSIGGLYRNNMKMQPKFNSLPKRHNKIWRLKQRHFPWWELVWAFARSVDSYCIVSVVTETSLHFHFRQSSTLACMKKTRMKKTGHLSKPHTVILSSLIKWVQKDFMRLCSRALLNILKFKSPWSVTVFTDIHEMFHTTLRGIAHKMAYRMV